MRRHAAVLSVLSVATLALALTACKKKPDYAGIGPWQLGKTTLKDNQGFCQEDGKLQWCHNQPPLELGGQSAHVDLYFRGEGPQARLVEILLDIRPCDHGQLKAYLDDALGGSEGANEAGDKVYWKNDHAFIAAKLPAEPNRCEVSFVEPDDTKRIADLKGETAAAADE